MADHTDIIIKNEDSSGIYDGKKAILTEKLQKRQENRMEVLNKKREEKKSTVSKEENVNLFSENFQKLKTSISEGLKRTSTISKTSVGDHLGKIAKEIDHMKKYITDATIYLPSYDVQKSQSTLSEFQNEFQKVQEKFLPKKKFAFKSKSKAGTKESVKVDSVKSTAVELSKFNVALNELCITDKVNETINLSESDVDEKDIALSNLQNCTIEIQAVVSSMQIDKLTNCRIICGPISRSSFINNCSNCTFILACQQLRIHHTTNTTFFVHVTTRAIIEDTTNVKFGQYCQNYPKFQDHWTKSGLDKSKNNWDDIDDFNYLASDAKSPNWSLVTTDEQDKMEKSLSC